MKKNYGWGSSSPVTWSYTLDFKNYNGISVNKFFTN